MTPDKKEKYDNIVSVLKLRPDYELIVNYVMDDPIFRKVPAEQKEAVREMLIRDVVGIVEH